MTINKYIHAEMATSRLKKAIAMEAKPLPEQIETLETDFPSGRARFVSSLYQAEKLKKITISQRSFGQNAGGAVVMIIADDEYDLPFVLADIAFDFAGEGAVTAGFQLRPLVKDEQSITNYIDPFRNWYQTIGKLPSESVHLDVGPFLQANPAPLDFLGRMPLGCLDEVLELSERFFDIFLEVHRKAEPVKDPERKNKMEAFRSEYNREIFGDDFSGKMLIKAFGRETAALFYDYLVYL